MNLQMSFCKHHLMKRKRILACMITYLEWTLTRDGCWDLWMYISFYLNIIKGGSDQPHPILDN